MSKKEIFSDFALIGENLDLKKNVRLEVDKKGKISKISYEELEKEIILDRDHQNLLMIPGLINSHVHIGDSFAKEMGFNRELSEIVAPLQGLKHNLLRKTPDDIIIEGMRNAAIEMLSNGITFFIDFREEGIRGLNLLKKALAQSPLKYLSLGRFKDETEIESIFQSADGVGLASYRKITEINKQKVLESKARTKKLVACHFAEKIRDVSLLSKILEDDLVDIIIHGTKLVKSDLKKIKIKNKSLVLCPRCNGYFGVGFPPIIDILNLKIPVSLGSDNLMLNNTDLFEEIRYLYRTFRVLGADQSNIQLTSKELLKMITINAAKNFKLDANYGSISVEKYADVLLIDLNAPNLFSYHMNNFYDIITQRIKSENIKKIIINGDIAFERK